MNFFHNKHGAFAFIAMIGFAFLLPVLVISSDDTTNIHLAKEHNESSQQRNLQVLTLPETCFTVHFATSSEENKGRRGKKAKKSKFYIVGYGQVPPDCQETGGACDIEICGRNTLDIVLTRKTKDYWKFSITGDDIIGQLVYHLENPNSAKQHSIAGGFPTKMGGNFDVIQSYQLLASPSSLPSLVPSPVPSPVPSLAPSLREDILLTIAIDVLGNCAIDSTNCAEDGRKGALEWFIKSDNHPTNYIKTSNKDRLKERLVLAILYFATNGENWANQIYQINWLSATDHCSSWHDKIYLEINCINGFVRYLNLFNHRLTGTIPAELGSLSKLEDLYLYGNHLTGNIPTELGSLSNLKDLDLQYNELSGNIPTELGSLSKLEELYLDENQLSGNIPTELGSLSKLEELYLDENQLTGNIPTELGSLSNLNRLDLSYNPELDPSIPVEVQTLCAPSTVDCVF